MQQIVDWFAGNGRYMNLVHCMGHDHFWIGVTIFLDLLVASGYVLIAMHWWKNERALPPVPAKRALGNMRNIFIFCGLCGYLFIPIKMVWPAWRLYDMFMVVLAYFTWRYAWGARDLKVVYNELGRSTRLAADLEKSRQETAEKTFFLNAISHDLRTPLNGLVLHADVAQLSAASGDADGLRDAVTQMKTSAQAAAALLDTFLDYAQLASAEAAAPVAAHESTFDLAELVTTIADRFRARAAERRLSLDVNVPQRVAVRFDRTKLERVLANLLDNALKFTERGGVRVEAETDGNALEIHVLDTGVGIAPQHVERLFGEFFQVANPERDHRKGFGLGLAIARRLARQLGGDVTVQTAPGRGSRFSIVLPHGVGRDPLAGSAPAAAATTSPGGNGSAPAGSAVAARAPDAATPSARSVR